MLKSPLSSPIKRALRSAFTPSGGGAVAPPSLVDIPIGDATVLALSQISFGVEKLVYTATNSVRLRRVSDSVEANFGFNALGEFDISAVASWAGGSNVELVHLIEQKGGTLLLVPNTRPVVMTGGVWTKRFGTSKDMTSTTVTGGDLSRTDEGGCGLDVNGVRFTLVGSGITVADGIEVTTLFSTNTRKHGTGSAVNADPKTSNSTTETLWRINSPASTSNLLDLRLATGNTMRFPRRVATATGNIITGGTPALGTTMVKNGTEVMTVGMTASTLFSYAKGEFVASITNPIGNVLDDPNLANGTLIIGSSSATAQSFVANTVFGAIIITKTLTNKQRYLLQEKLTQVAQYHLRATTTELLAGADEVIDMRDVNAGTGLIAGKKGKTSIQFSTGGDWNFAHTITSNGLQGIRSPIQAGGTHHAPSDYEATNNYFAQTTKKAVSMLTFGRTEFTSNELKYWVGVADTTNQAVAYISHGRDHLAPSLETLVDAVVDTSNYAQEAFGFGDNGGNQAMVKYSFKLSPSWNTPFTTTIATTLNALYRFVITDGIVPIGTVLNNAWFKTNLGLDAPTPEFKMVEGDMAPATPPYNSSQYTYEQAVNTLDLMISTHKPSDAWDGTSSNIHIKRATNHLYIGNSGLFGHADSSICRTESGNHYLSKSTSRIRRVRGGDNSAAHGTLLMWMFFDKELTPVEAQKYNVNLYKFYV